MGCGVHEETSRPVSSSYDSVQQQPIIEKKKLTDAFLPLMIRFIIKYWKKNNKNT